MESGKREARRRAPRWSSKVQRAMRADGDEWSRSGMSGEAFGRSKGIAPQRLSYWKKRLAKKKRELAFVPVKVAATRVVVSARMEIERDGVVFRVREDLGAEQISRIVTALRGGGRGC